MLYPISFSVHESKILSSVPAKTQLLAKIVPGQLHTYIYQNEVDYYAEYQRSLFAITTEKGGMDCLRHYEILANGCIPLFHGIESCPVRTLFNFPKEIIVRAKALYHELSTVPDPFHYGSAHLIEACRGVTNELLTYSREHLTNRAVASYILQASGNHDASRILFLCGITQVDYLPFLTVSGFKDLFGTGCHEYPKMEPIYSDYSGPLLSLYGKGMTYSRVVDASLRDDSLDASIRDDIIAKKYDCIVYGSLHHGTPFLDLVSEHYPSDKIIMCCGEDKNGCCHAVDGYSMPDPDHHLFVRELRV